MEPFCKEIADRFQYMEDRWREVRDAAREDMRYVAGDPWDPKEKMARKAVNRPCLVLDELGQYINALINDVRQNKRGIQVDPKGAGSDDKTAERNGNIIRGIEYVSQSQDAYICGFENAAQRSYGYWRVNTRYVEDKSFDQEIVIERIPNPDTVWLDPDCKKIECSDGKDAFVVDLIPKPEFIRRWPNSAIVDFSTEIMEVAPHWIREETVQVAEYWKVDEKPRKLWLVKADKGMPPFEMWEDEQPDKFDMRRIIKERKSTQRIVTQYITNGVEILEENAWAGRYIPIIPCFGKEIWVDEGAGAKRVLMSLIRLARDPYMLYCYYRTTEAELVSMVPKSPYVGIEGQFAGHEEEWQSVNTSPLAYLQYKAQTAGTGDQLLPPPSRNEYDPPIQPLEIGAESARRAIQSAMGINPLPTAAQRLNEKSGVALEKIQSQADQGTFHFIDNFNRAIAYTGRIIEDLIPKIYDTARHVPIQDKEGNAASIEVNQPEKPESDLSIGEHGVTISIGPSFDSQREKADSFVDTIVANIQALPLAPEKSAKLLALAIKLKQLGPLGDKMSDIIDPTQSEAQMQAQMAQMQQQLTQYQQLIAGLQAENQKLYAEKQGKVVDNEYALKMEALSNDVKILIAEIQTKAQAESERNAMFLEYWKEQHGSAHELAMAQTNAQNAQQLAAQQAQQVQPQVNQPTQ